MLAQQQECVPQISHAKAGWSSSKHARSANVPVSVRIDTVWPYALFVRYTLPAAYHTTLCVCPTPHYIKCIYDGRLFYSRKVSNHAHSCLKDFLFFDYFVMKTYLLPFQWLAYVENYKKMKLMIFPSIREKWSGIECVVPTSKISMMKNAAGK